LALDLSGRPRTTQVNPVIAVADAFSAQAAGYPKPAHVLLSSAIALNSKWPTYYGSAWVSLGELLLARNGFSSCAPF
jgi:hypothetical protein